MDHHCHARRCDTSCKPELLMCPGHWKMVPYVLQQRVWNTYRPGQCDDKQPSEAWHAAADAAIEYVARAEAAKLTPAMIDIIQALGRGSGALVSIGGQCWKPIRKNESMPRQDGIWCGTVTVNRLARAGLIERGHGSNAGYAKITNAGIAWFVSPLPKEASDVDHQG